MCVTGISIVCVAQVPARGGRGRVRAGAGGVQRGGGGRRRAAGGRALPSGEAAAAARQRLPRRLLGLRAALGHDGKCGISPWL